MKWYRSLNADVAGIETKDELDDLGSEAPGSGGIDMPVKAKFIRRIIIAVGCDGAALGNLVSFIRLEGDGIVNDETLVTDGFTIPVATGTGNVMRSFISPILNFPVNGGSGVKVFADSFGDAESDFEVGVTLELVDAKEAPAVNENAEMRTRSYTADIDTVDAVVDVTGDLGSDGNPGTKVPDGVETLEFISVNAGWDEGADGSSVLFVRLKGDWLTENQPHTIMVMGRGSIAGQTGSDEGVQRSPPFVLEDMGLEVSAGSTIQMDFENAGDDPGSGTAGITLGFA